VGFVVETRPDLVDEKSARDLRRLGCTKVQMGVQSLDDELLAANGRRVDAARIAGAMACLRAFGFKTHVHFMANLLGSDPARDRADYARLFSDPAFRPDEVKIYPCSLVGSSRLAGLWRAGAWRPYGEDELVDLLVADTLATPAYARISRMVRDFSSTDILAGVEKPNLRQLVEGRIDAAGLAVAEIRHREIALDACDPATLELVETDYDTAATREKFLEWRTPEGRIAGFLRLSLPEAAWPFAEKGAMIREVHVYGAVAKLHETGEGTQHLGLGRALVARACEIAAAEGYGRIRVISAVGTRGYYRRLGFSDDGLYQSRAL
jgi:elongator complex protein 3